MILVGLFLGTVVLSRLMRSWLQHSTNQVFLEILWAPGTVIHEGSHWLACKMTGTKVYNVKLYTTEGQGYAGFVEHEKTGRVRMGFIGIAPLLFMTAILYLLAVFLLPRNANIDFSLIQKGQILAEGSFLNTLLTSWQTYVFVFIAFFLVLGLCPSKEDFKYIPYFLLAVLALGVTLLLAGWVVIALWNPPGMADSVLKGLKAVNSGFILTIVSILVIYAILLLLSWVLSSR